MQKFPKEKSIASILQIVLTGQIVGALNKINTYYNGFMRDA